MGLVQPFPAGGTITAAALAAAIPLAAFKYADQNSGQNNTTLTNDTDLNLALVPNGTYVGYGMIVFAASTAANYKCTLTAPAGATGGWNPNAYLGSGGSAFVTNDVFLAFGTTLATAGQGTATNASFTFQFSVIMGANAGNLQYEFCQNTLDASNLNTRAASFLLAWRIA